MALAGWGIFMREGNIFKTRAVSVTRTCFEGNVLGWDSTGTRLSNLGANLMSKTDVLNVSDNVWVRSLLWNLDTVLRWF